MSSGNRRETKHESSGFCLTARRPEWPAAWQGIPGSGRKNILIKILVDELVHLEHRHFMLAKYRGQILVGEISRLFVSFCSLCFAM